MPTAPVRVVIAGGGTGGHLFPGIAIARALAARFPGAQISFAGTAAGLEATVVPREGFPLDVIRSAGIKGKSPAALARGLALLPLSAVDAWRVVSRRAPDLVIGVGGYSSGPIVLVAALRGAATLLHEQNAVPGFTNRQLGRVVDAAAVTYEATLPYFGARGFVSGNPVRPEFFDDTAEGRPAEGPVRLLIFGGSQGARAINEAVVAAAPALAAAPRPLEILHQTGARDLEMVRDGYRRAGLAGRVEAFVHAMAGEMKRADLVVCRAGATTIAELAAARRAALLVPLPTAADDHQRRNARVLVEAGAAEMLEQTQMSGAVLASRILALAGDRDRRAAMAAAIARFARPDAARTIVDRAAALVAARGRTAG
jgi:UDP-N-acetylglucosamine--N-acetylmuramyl-(pentapeptide) pyrophosphoryl-undecaprenol N-acetylglucosamine transferase